MEVSYAQNLISTLNTVMRAVRRDQTIWLSPADAVGKRSYIRTTLPLATWDKVLDAVRLAEAMGNYRGAALVLLWRAFGMRFREAALADLHRMKAEADIYNAVRILRELKEVSNLKIGEFQLKACSGRLWITHSTAFPAPARASLTPTIRSKNFSIGTRIPCARFSKTSALNALKTCGLKISLRSTSEQAGNWLH